MNAVNGPSRNWRPKPGIRWITSRLSRLTLTAAERHSRKLSMRLPGAVMLGFCPSRRVLSSFRNRVPSCADLAFLLMNESEATVNARPMTRKRPQDLRSHRWFGASDLRSFGHRSRLRQFGYDAADWEAKPVIGIINTWSDINACHGHLRARANDVRRGVLQAGGLPIELPAMSLAEPMVKPSTMLYRNFLAMETEELLRSHPIDGAVLMGGCDK